MKRVFSPVLKNSMYRNTAVIFAALILFLALYRYVYLPYFSPISRTISKMGSTHAYSYQNANPRNGLQSEFFKKSSPMHLYTLEDTPSGGTLVFSLLPDKKNQKLHSRQLDTNHVVVNDVAPATHIVYTIAQNGDGVKEDIVLRNASAISDARYRFRLDVDKLSIDADPVTHMLTPSFRTSDGKHLFQLLPPFMVDARGVRSNKVKMIIEEIKTDNQETHAQQKLNGENPNTKSYIITVIPDMAWLADTSRAYPVTIDPSVVKGNAPVASWNMDEGVGLTASDASGNGNHLTLNGSAPWVRTDSSMTTQTSSIQFDGTNDSLSRAYDTDFDFGTGSFSVSSWFKHTSVVSGTDTLMARYNGAGWKIYMTGSGTICFGIDDDATFNPDDSACSQLQYGSYADSKWHHLEAVKSTTSSITLYIDGQQVGTDTSLAATATLNGTSPVLYLGIDSDGGSNPWTGFIDTTTIYTYARDINQIKADAMIAPQTQASFGSSGDDVLTDGLAGWWKMDEGTGTTLTDATGNVNTGTLGTGSSAPTWTTGQFGTALSFDGTDDRVNLASTPLNPSSSDFTASVWFKTNSLVNVDDIISQNDGTGTGRSWLQLETFHIQTFLGGIRTTGATTLSTGVWYFATVTKKGSEINLYLNGRIDKNRVQTVESATGALNFGMGKSSNNFFDGTLDDIRIYNRALSAQEVEALYRWSAGPVGYWNMDDHVSLTSVSDISGNNNTLTINGVSSDPWVTGQYSTGLSFDGSLSYLSSTYDSDFDFGTNNFTLETWFNHGANSVTTSVTAQPDATAGIDTMTQEGAADTASDTQEFFQPNDDAPFRRFGLLKFDLSGIPAGAGVSSATLYLYKYSAASSGFYGTSQIFRMLPANSTWTEAATWNYAVPSTTRWAGDTGSNGGSDAGASVSATDFSSTVMGTLSMLDADAQNNEYAINLNSTEMANMISNNYGFVINATSATEPRISTSDTSNGASYRPKLVVNYTQDETMLARYNGAGWKVYRKADGTVCFGIDDDSSFTPDDSACTTTTYSDSKWHFVSAVKKDSAITLFIDGVPVASDTSLAATGSLSGSTPSFFVGVGSSGNSNFFLGKLDDTRIYNYARTGTQVITDMNGGHPIGGSPIGSQVAYWKFDEGYGTTANDQSVNLHNLTLSSSRWTKNGKFGMAWDGSGPGSGVRLSRTDDNDLDFDGSADFTISTWFKSDTSTNPSSNQYLVDKEAGTGYGIYANTSGNIVFGIDTDGTWSPANSVVSISDIYDGNWHYIAAVKTGISKIELYVDKNLENIDSSLVAPGATLENSDSLTVGDQDTAIGNEFAGDIDELKIYRAALTPNQIYLDYNQGRSSIMGALSTDSDGITASNSSSREYCVPGDTATCSSPVGEWKINENGGATTYDTSGNGNNGVFTGSTMWSQSCHDGSSCIDLINSNSVGEGTTIADPASGVLDFDNTQSFTTEVWFKSNASENSAYAPLWKGGQSTSVPGYDTEVSTSDSFARCHYVGANSVSDTATGTTAIVNDGKWHHVTCVMDRTAGALIIYVDGVREGADTNLTATTGVNSSNLIIGEGIDATWEFSGSVDDAKIYNYARTPSQVAWDYNKGAPAAWYELDECSGTTAFNSALSAGGLAAGADGTITIGAGPSNTTAGTCLTSGAWAAGATGKIGSALDFDGSDDYVDVSGSSLINGGSTASMSLVAWVKASTNSDSYPIFKFSAFAPSGPGEYYFRILNNLWNATTRGGTGSVSSLDTVSIGSWTHLALTWVSNSSLNFYVDGLLQGSDSTPGVTSAASQSLFLGRWSTTYFKGQIDDVRVYKYPLTVKQIQIIMNEGAVSFR